MVQKSGDFFDIADVVAAVEVWRAKYAAVGGPAGERAGAGEDDRELGVARIGRDEVKHAARVEEDAPAVAHFGRGEFVARSRRALGGFEGDELVLPVGLRLPAVAEDEVAAARNHREHPPRGTR